MSKVTFTSTATCKMPVGWKCTKCGRINVTKCDVNVSASASKQGLLHSKKTHETMQEQVYGQSQDALELRVRGIISDAENGKYGPILNNCMCKSCYHREPWATKKANGCLVLNCFLVAALLGFMALAALFLTWEWKPVCSLLGIAAVLIGIAFISMKVTSSNEKKMIPIYANLKTIERPVLAPNIDILRQKMYDVIAQEAGDRDAINKAIDNEFFVVHGIRIKENPPYTVELILCIDGNLAKGKTRADGNDRLVQVKNMASNIAYDVRQKMEADGKEIKAVRVREIVFREYLADGAEAMLDTDFYRLPHDRILFEGSLNCICSKRESSVGDALEALCYAIKSDWSADDTHARQVIVIWSDKETNDLGTGCKSNYYPKGAARTISELQSWWDKMGNSRRLVLLTPNTKRWKYIAESWDYVLHYPSQAGEGMPDSIYREIINCIAREV